MSQRREWLPELALAVLAVLLLVLTTVYVRAASESGDERDRLARQIEAAGSSEALAARVAALQDEVDGLRDGPQASPFPTRDEVEDQITGLDLAPLVATDLPRIRVFVDPNTTTDMAPLGPGERFIYVVHGVSDATPIDFRWSYTPTNPGPGSDTRIEIFEGFSTDTEDRIRNNTDNNSPHTLTLGAGANDGGTFTFGFTNESAVPLASEPFGDQGETNRTWMGMEAGIDQIVTSTVADLSLRAYLQQGPGGTTGAQRTVAVAGWLRLDN